MILYCDTSALIKLLIQEPGSQQLQTLSSTAAWVATCRITWAEAMAAMARRLREDPLSVDAIDEARGRLIQIWGSLAIVEVSQEVVEAAGRFADGFALRGYDGVQLAAAAVLKAQSDQPLTFACFDRRLNQAAQLLQLEVLR